ncbi:hypothetical protein [Actinoplanes regularis]|uniref:Uncharacterized protein n=1 Tax=Actinoplanes regularis TaxID=52697 RepID=A0A239GTA6_9ACTN|nr:hypothetical protein [Actinoplanes regularis]GIE90881.1 hypothetical protein Are01nite_73610 [Actinoplanes regularis]SNS72456.1 hypothetical protein SAMN06264365_12262 [Actinoplanes regularis]
MTATSSENVTCLCGDYGCEDTFGRATAGQDRSDCCQYCGYYGCDVCGWSDPARNINPATDSDTRGGTE